MNLVTGATGIAGSHVLYQLMREGKPVLAARRAQSNLAETRNLFRHYSGSDELFSRIKWIELDINDSGALDDAMNGVSSVYHCAGVVSFDPADREVLMKVNEKGTATVVNACLAKGIRLCHLSSVATIHNLDYLLPLDESVFWKKSGSESDYAVSKYNAEREVWRGMEEGLQAVIVNPGLMVAPGFFSQSSMRLFSRTAQGNRYYTDGVLAMVGAADVAGVMIRLMDEQRTGHRYILVEGNRSYREVFQIFADALQVRGPAIQAGPGILRLAAFLEALAGVFTGRRPQLAAPVRASAFNKQSFSAEKVLGELGFRFTPLEKLAREAAEVYLKSGQKST